MTLKPCIYCPHSPKFKNGVPQPPCEIKSEKLAQIRGAKLTSVAFQCERVRAEFQPGSVGLVRLIYPEFNGETFEIYCVIMRWKGHRLLVAFQPGEGDDLPEKPMGKFWPREITLTGDRVPVCGACGKPEGLAIVSESGDPWHCSDCSPLKPADDQDDVSGVFDAF